MHLPRAALFPISVFLAAAILACGGGRAAKTATVTVARRTVTAAATLAPTTPAPTATLALVATPISEAIPPVTGQPTVTSSGLQIYELQAGSGTEARVGSIIRIMYKEWLSTGLQIENTTIAVPWRLTQGRVLQGWLEGIPGMREGGKRRLIIPPALAWGAAGSPDVPPNSTLIDDIELIAVTQQ